MATTTVPEQVQSPPTVLIVGAGLGGVMLGALLERAGIPFTIVERASKVKPLGSALSIGGNLLPAFEQLSMYDEFLAMSKLLVSSHMLKEKKDFSFELVDVRQYLNWGDLSGYSGYIVSRPLLYDLLLKQIPSHKIHMNKRIVSITENKEGDNKVHIQAADGISYHGDILVGADGAYSTVRQGLYEQLRATGALPKSDQGDLPCSCTCLVGQTEPLDVEEYPELKDPHCPYWANLGHDDKPYTDHRYQMRPLSLFSTLPCSHGKWVLFSTLDKRICFMVLNHLDEITSRVAQEQKAKNGENSEWGPHAAQSMCDITRDFRLPIGTGKTLGDLYDKTPKELISKVMLEEKVFSTWHSGRTVLLGDACHKLHPASGQGAIMAMHDAIALANLIYALPTNNDKDIHQMFTEYQAERLPYVSEAFDGSRTLARSLEKGWTGAITLRISSYVPQWLWKIFWTKVAKVRPQIGFLSQIPLKGSVVPNVSHSTEKARAIYEKRQ
ncbi:hypothetical protein BGZ96_004927, partial [Linnemannia gamsii]